jgi:hypothetical protein
MAGIAPALSLSRSSLARLFIPENAAHGSRGSLHIRKADDVHFSHAVLLEQHGVREVAADLTEAPTLTAELAGFQMKVTAAGHDT